MKKAVTILAMLIAASSIASEVETTSSFDMLAKLNVETPIYDTLPDGNLVAVRNVSDTGALITRYKDGAKLMVSSRSFTSGAKSSWKMAYKPLEGAGFFSKLGAFSYNAFAGVANAGSSVVGAATGATKATWNFGAEQVTEHPWRTLAVIGVVGQAADWWDVRDIWEDDDPKPTSNVDAVKDGEGGVPSQLQVTGEENQVLVKTTERPEVIQIDGIGNSITVEEFEPEEEE